MAYATLTQVIERYGVGEIAQLLCDEQGVLTEAMLRDAIINDDITVYTAEEQAAIGESVNRANNILEAQSHAMDSKIGVRYQLPLRDSENSSVVECCMALARAAFADDGTNISTRITDDRDHWRKWLEHIAGGRAVLNGELAIAAGGEPVRYIVGKLNSHIPWDNY